MLNAEHAELIPKWFVRAIPIFVNGNWTTDMTVTGISDGRGLTTHLKRHFVMLDWHRIFAQPQIARVHLLKYDLFANPSNPTNLTLMDRMEQWVEGIRMYDEIMDNEPRQSLTFVELDYLTRSGRLPIPHILQHTEGGPNFRSLYRKLGYGQYTEPPYESFSTWMQFIDDINSNRLQEAWYQTLQEFSS